MIYLTGMGLIWLTAVRQPTATMRLMHVSTGMKSATMSGLKYFSYWKSGIRISRERHCLILLGPHSSHHTLATGRQDSCWAIQVLDPTLTNKWIVYISNFIFHVLNCWVVIFACMPFPIVCDWYLDRPRRSAFLLIVLLQLIVIAMRTPGIGSFQEATTMLGLGEVWNYLLSNIGWSR